MAKAKREVEEVQATISVNGGPEVPRAEMERAVERLTGGERRPAIRQATHTCEVIAERVEKDSDFAETLTLWPKSEKFCDARQPMLLLKELVRSIDAFEHVRGRQIGAYYQEKTFSVSGREAIGKVIRPAGLLRQISECDWIFVFAWEVWQGLAPWQKVSLVFHELLHTEVDAEKGTPAIRPHEFEGFFSELEVFGTSTFQEWELLSRAAARGSVVHAQQELFGETGKDEEVA